MEDILKGTVQLYLIRLHSGPLRVVMGQKRHVRFSTGVIVSDQVCDNPVDVYGDKIELRFEARSGKTGGGGEEGRVRTNSAASES